MKEVGFSFLNDISDYGNEKFLIEDKNGNKIKYFSFWRPLMNCFVFSSKNGKTKINLKDVNKIYFVSDKSYKDVVLNKDYCYNWDLKYNYENFWKKDGK